MEISYRISWRRSVFFCDASRVEQQTVLRGEGSLRCQAGCSGTIAPMSFVCTGFSATENWSFGENRHTFTFSSTSSSTVTIGFSGSAWLAPFNSAWNIPTTFSLTRRSDTGLINSSPRAITSPVVRLQQGCNHNLQVAISDPDGDIVRCRWAVGSAECGGVCNRFPGAILDSDTCALTYEANRGTGFNAVAIMIEDFLPGSSQPLSSVALQFLVDVFSSSQSCSSQPQFISPTLMGGTCVAIPSGTTFTTQIIASSGEESVSVTQFQTVSPIGLTRSEIQQLPGTQNYFTDVTWTPTADQEDQTHLFCYTAVNSAGQVSEQTCIQLASGFSPPTPVPDTAFPNRTLVQTFNTTWNLTFDQAIQRPSLSAFIRFHNSTEQVVYQIDTSTSSEITFNDNTIFITPDFQFLENMMFYITLDADVVIGMEGCNQGNEPVTDSSFWTFEIPPPEGILLFRSTSSCCDI